MDRADAAGLGIAAALHVGLLAALILLIPRDPIRLPGAPTMEISYEEEVGIVSAGETMEPRAPSSAPEEGPPEQAAPAEALPQPLPAPVPPQPPLQPQAQARPTPPASAPQPRPQPQQRTQKPPRPQAPQQRTATPPRPQAPQQRTATPSRQQSQRQSGTGNRQTSRGPLTAANLNLPPSETNGRSSQPAGAVVTAEARATMDAAILRALQPCRRQALPAPEAGSIRVRVEVTLNPNGGLASARVLSVTGATGNLAIYEQRMRDLATNVIEQCAPIRGLPAEYYNVARGWRTFRYVFPA